MLRITKEASTTTVTLGVPFDYILTVTNEGTAPTTAAVTVSDDGAGRAHPGHLAARLHRGRCSR